MCYLWCPWNADNNGALKLCENHLKYLNAFESREKMFTVPRNAALTLILLTWRIG